MTGWLKGSAGAVVLVLQLFISVAIGDSPREMDLLVIDEASGKPLEGAKVLVNENGKNKTLQTSADGHVALTLPTESKAYFSASVELDGYVKKLLQWSPGPNREFPAKYQLKLEPAVSISGKVTDDEGKPIKGARVIISIRDGNNQARRSIESSYVSYELVRSVDGGLWTFHGAPQKFETVDVGVWDYRYACGDFYDFKKFTFAEAREGAIALVLPRGTPIKGMVLGPDEKPLEGATVMYGSSMASNTMDPQRTKENGRFNYAAKPGEKVTLTVTAKEHAPGLATFTIGNEPEEVMIQLAKAKPMFGRIVGPDNEPVPFAWVYPDTWRGTRRLNTRIRADKEGKFRWENPPDDEVLFHIDGISAGYVREQMNLTTSDADGKLQFPPQLTDYLLVVHCNDGFAQVESKILESDSKINLRGWGKVEGILKLDGAPAAGEQIQLVPQAVVAPNAPRVYHQFSVKTEINGQFTIDHVPSGDVSVSRRVDIPVDGRGFRVNTTLTQNVIVKEGESTSVVLEGAKDPVPEN